MLQCVRYYDVNVGNSVGQVIYSIDAVYDDLGLDLDRDSATFPAGVNVEGDYAQPQDAVLHAAGRGGSGGDASGLSFPGLEHRQVEHCTVTPRTLLAVCSVTVPTVPTTVEDEAPPLAFSRFG